MFCSRFLHISYRFDLKCVLLWWWRSYEYQGRRRRNGFLPGQPSLNYLVCTNGFLACSTENYCDIKKMEAIFGTGRATLFRCPWILNMVMENNDWLRLETKVESYFCVLLLIQRRTAQIVDIWEANSST